MFFLVSTTDNYVINVSKSRRKVIVSNDRVHYSLESRDCISQTKRNYVILKELPISLKSCESFLFFPEGDLVVGALKVKLAENFVFGKFMDQVVDTRDRIGI